MEFGKKVAIFDWAENPVSYNFVSKSDIAQCIKINTPVYNIFSNVFNDFHNYKVYIMAKSSPFHIKYM